MTPKMFQNVTYRRQGSRNREKELQIGSELVSTVPRIELITAQQEVEMTGIGRDEATFQSLLKALNALAKGQTEMAGEMRRNNINKGYKLVFVASDGVLILTAVREDKKH